MKKAIFILSLIATATLVHSFKIEKVAKGNTTVTENHNNTCTDGNGSFQQDAWYICENCCKTLHALSFPVEGGCRAASDRMHDYKFFGYGGDFNWTCRDCAAVVYLSSDQGLGASRCCATGAAHNWYHRR
jgi:hypothetical protein